jgi:hypothetical protein
MLETAETGDAKRQAAALEIVRREALRSGKSLRGVLSLVRVSNPPTPSERLLLAAVRVLKSPHVIMPQRCYTMAEWCHRYVPN